MMKALYDEAGEAGVELGGVFAAAGIQLMKEAVDYSAKDFRRIMDVNVTGEPSLRPSTLQYRVRC